MRRPRPLPAVARVGAGLLLLLVSLSEVRAQDDTSTSPATQIWGQDRTLYAIGDAEYYAPLRDDVPERYVNKLRARIGLGFVFSAATRLEFLYIRDWNRSSPDASATRDTQAFDLRLKKLF